MLTESWGAILTGWVHKNLIDPQFNFPFMDFGWLQPLPGYGMYGYFFVMGCAALGVLLGWRYRWSAILLAICWSGAYFMQKTSYNNHYYLAVLLCWWMVFLPANKRFSLDAARTGVTTYVHRYWVTAFAKTQLLIVFTYGALAKFYPGWLNGDFVEQSFNGKASYWLIGPLLAQDWFQWFITYAAIAFDGLIIPMLWWKPTRRLAFLGLIFFNLFNSAVFHIGIFPYLVLAFTVFFFEPSYIEGLFRVPKKSVDQEVGYGNASEIQESRTQLNPLSSLASSAILLYLIVQLALPLRHHFIPGDVNWREEGHRLSWRMMLRAKGGYIKLQAVNPVTNQRETIKLKDYLTPKQQRQLATKPDFVYQFVQRLKAHYDAKGWEELEIYVKSSRVYLNGDGPSPLFAKDVDLTKVEWNRWGRNEWVVDRKPVVSNSLIEVSRSEE